MGLYEKIIRADFRADIRADFRADIRADQFPAFAPIGNLGLGSSYKALHYRSCI